VDLARFILGEIRAVNGITKTFIDRRPLIDDSTKKGIVDVEDAFASTVEFENGAIGTLEASRFAFGRKNYNNFEINGENGSIEFNLERLNELRLYSNEGAVEKRGWNEILVTDRSHPYISHYWPSGHIIGWEHTFINEIYHFIDAVVNDKKVEPYGATFEDGYRNMVILDSIIKSAEKGKRISIAF
jgi:predicted dehydrogenase